MRLRTKLATILTSLSLFGTLVVPVLVHADEARPVNCDGKKGFELAKCRIEQEKFVSAAGYENATTDVTVVVGRVINIALSLLGIVFLGLAIYGGYLWMNAKGDKEEVQKGKNTIERAVFGLAIILAAYAITNFVVGQLSNVTGLSEGG